MTQNECDKLTYECYKILLELPEEKFDNMKGRLLAEAKEISEGCLNFMELVISAAEKGRLQHEKNQKCMPR